MGEPCAITNRRVAEGSTSPLGASSGSRSPLGRLYNVPQLPPHYLQRNVVTNKLKKRLLSGESAKFSISGTATRIGIQGMGGIGKTIVAAAIAQDADIRKKFSSGIVWVEVGKNPAIVDLQSQICDVFEDNPPSINNKRQGKSHLSKLLTDKSCLLILDDVWATRDVSAFDAIGSNSKLLVTTRNENVIKGVGAEDFKLDLLDEAQSLELLRRSSNIPSITELPIEANELVKECGFLPLAISMVGSMARNKPKNRWGLILKRLQDSDIRKIGIQYVNYPYPNVFKAIHVSVESLRPVYRDRYFDLAIFPDNFYIPEQVFETFWADDDLQGILPWEILDEFVGRSLAHRGYNDGISLHDLQFDYIRRDASDLTDIHTKLLTAYEKSCPDGWASGPDDGYYRNFLIFHLKKVGRSDHAREAAENFLLRVPGLWPKKGIEYLQLLGEDAKRVAKLLIKRPTTSGTITRYCIKLLGYEARSDAQRLLRTSKSPEVLCACLDLLGKSAKDDAKKLIRSSQSHEVICTCIDLLGTEARDEARILLRQPNTHPFVISQALNLLNQDAKNEAKRLIETSDSHEVLCTCLNILGNEAKEHAKQLINEKDTHPYVVCACLDLLGDEGSDEANYFLYSATHPFILSKCISILKSDAIPFAVEQIKNWRKVNKSLLVRCFQVAGNTTEARYAAEDMLKEWDNHLPSILRVVALRVPFDTSLRIKRAEEIISSWQRQYRPLVSAALSAYWNNPNKVELCCRSILHRWHSEILYQKKRRIKRYDGHIIKALSNPLLKTEAKDAAEKMLIIEKSEPCFLSDELSRVVHDIADGIYPQWLTPLEETTV